MHYDNMLSMLKSLSDAPADAEIDILDDRPNPIHSHQDLVYDLLIKNARVVTMDANQRIIERANIAIKDGIILLITTDIKSVVAAHIIDADENMITPGLIDCHTHLVYAGNRASEFSQRLSGVSQEEITRQGGGVFGTVKATRRASLEDLNKQALQRAMVMLSHGTTTVEIKSGYGLDLNTEIKILTVARMLSKSTDMTVVPTFLGAPTTPSEYQCNPDAYMDYVIHQLLPVIAKKKLALFVNAFCDDMLFTSEQMVRLFQAAASMGLKLKLHAEQLLDPNIALLARRYPVCSVDHIEALGADDCKYLVNDNTVAVLLPGIHYGLKETIKPPIEALRQHHIPIAIATDANSGSSPFLTLPLMMNMACVLFGLTIDEAWQGVTMNAAKALSLHDEIGSVEIGKKADLVIWSTNSLDDVVYNPSINYCKTIIKSGVIMKIKGV